MVITNPARSGDLVDFTDQDKFLLTVNSIPVDLKATSIFRMDDFTVDYDTGKTLSFTEATSIGAPSFGLDKFVTLQMDLGDGLLTYFRGRIRMRNRLGKNANEGVQYVAFGYQQLANEITLVDENGLPLIAWYGGTDATTIGTTVVYGQSIEGALTYCFTCNATSLFSIGIPATIGSPGLDAFTGILNDNVSIQNTQFLGAIQQLVQHQPSKRVYWDDLQNAWCFPDLLSATIENITLGTDNLEQFEYEEDLSDRATAIELWSPWEGTYTIPYKGFALLTPLWEEVLEDDWCMQKTSATTISTVSSTTYGDYWMVFRRWEIPAIIEDANPRAPTRLYVQGVRENPGAFIAVDAHVDMKNRIVTAASPIVVKGNPYDPGHATGPPTAYITFYKVDVMPTSGWANLRVPTSGYEGTAFELHGLERTRKEVVDLVQLSTDIAQSRLDVLKDVIISGAPIIEGDPIPELVNLQKRIRALHNTLTTGLESVAAVYMGYTYRFAPRGENVLRLTTDMTGLVRVN